jgi:hypothetical protein
MGKANGKALRRQKNRQEAPARVVSITAAHREKPPLLEDRLKGFLAANPEIRYQGKKGFAILETPWGDPSIVLFVHEKDHQLVEALGPLRLPQRFSAIWHRDSRQLEFIWQTLPEDHHLRSRAFTFCLNGEEYDCRFGDSSFRLLTVARSARFVRGSVTGFRNLSTLSLHWRDVQLSMRNAQESEPAAPGIATSFWIEPIDWDDNKVADVAAHLNFYMPYFDFQTPRVIFHEAQSGGLVNESRYPRGDFPSRLDAKQVDSNLLMVWQSLFEAPDSFRRFLYAYQVLEYRAFYFMQDKISQLLRRIFSSPDTIARSDEAVRQIFDAFTDSRMGDDARLEAVLKGCVNPDTVWSQLALNLAFFSDEVRFDGGFVMEPLLSKDETQEHFRTMWATRFSTAIRKLRNALVHGRESRQAVTIAPTRGNHTRLRPWIAPIIVAAQEATIFCD